jgi:hypothetical protein
MSPGSEALITIATIIDIDSGPLTSDGSSLTLRVTDHCSRVRIMGPALTSVTAMMSTGNVSRSVDSSPASH